MLLSRCLHLGVIISLFYLFPDIHCLAEGGRAKEFYLKHSGYTSTTVAHFQLGLDLNLETIFSNLEKLGTIIGAQEASNAYGHHFHEPNSFRLKRLKTRLQATWNLGNPVGGGDRDPDIEEEPRREKRFVAAALPFVFNLGASVYRYGQLRQMKHRMLKQEKKLSALVLLVEDNQVTLGNHSLRLEKIEQWALLVEAKVDTLAYVTKAQFFIENHFADIETQVAQAESILDQLLAGRLSHTAVAPDTMVSLLKEMHTGAAASGHTLLVSTIGEAFQSKASVIPTRKGFFAILHVPIAKANDVMDLWLVVRVPISISDNRHMTIETNYEAIAVAPDTKTFRPMTLSELTVCDKRGQFHFCADGNIHHRQEIIHSYDGTPNDRLCLFFLYDSRYEDIRRACRFSVAPPSDQGFLLSGTEAVFVGASPQQGDLKCPNGRSTTFQVEGITKVDVPDKCIAETRFFSVTGVEETRTDAKRGLVWPSSIPPLWNNLDLTLLDELELEGAASPPSDTADLRLYLEEARTHRNSYISRSLLWACLALLTMAASLAVVWLWRNKRLVQRRARAVLVQGVDRLLEAVAARGRPEEAEHLRVALLAPAPARIQDQGQVVPAVP